MDNKQLGNFFANIIITVGVIAILSFLCMFSWNFGILYLFPSFGEIGYFNSLAIVVLIAIAHLTVNFYINKYMILKNARTEIGQNFHIISMLDAINDKIDALEEKDQL